MAFGFGFNKQKVLAAAEKYVQQGKLQNAIAEYEKILKNDSKDLTVTNTVGDLYARIGENDKATECFKSVGDAYASQGFTVKGIAMYKKISKLKPSLESVLKLAELYTQQGLFNDARAQYLQVAEEFLRAGELEQSVRIFQKILEMDPDNVAMRVRLAEVYIRLGKKQDAWQIFSAAAESLRSRGSLLAAEEILQRMLALDPANSQALLLRGRNALEGGDAAAAIQYFEKVPDLDAHADGMRELFRAYMQVNRVNDAGILASKLLAGHNDAETLFVYLDALAKGGFPDEALLVIDQNADRLLAENAHKVQELLHSLIGHLAGNAGALEKVLELLHKAGDTSHINEATELLAHASVQAGDLAKARDLYEQLAQQEPQNPMHMQNYQQVAGMMAGGSGARLITVEEGVVLVDELETTAPVLNQTYSPEIAKAVRSALTDAELFISYNMPEKALGPLMAALPIAPQDVRLNQRLAALHTRAERFEQAASCCRALEQAYNEAGYTEDGARYGELAQRYEERSAAGTLAPPQTTMTAASTTPWPVTAEPADDLAEGTPTFEIHAEEHDSALPEMSAVPEVTLEPTEADPDAVEIDLSSEWNDSPAEEAAEAVAGDTAHAVPPEGGDPVHETVEEIRFYLEHGMVDQARAAYAKLETLTDDTEKLITLLSEIEAATSAPEEAVSVEEVSEPEAAEPEAVAEALPAQEEPAPFPEAAADEMSVKMATAQDGAAAEADDEFEREVEIEAPTGSDPALVGHLEFMSTAPQAAAHHEPEPSTAHQEPVEHEEPSAEPVVAEDGSLNEFVADLEQSLGDGFLAEQPAAQTGHEVVPAPAHPDLEPEPAIAASAPHAPVSAPVPAPVARPAVSAGAAAAAAPALQPATTPATQPAPTFRTSVRPAAGASPALSPAGIDLADMFGELKHELEEDVAHADEDPETHYNLGVAFREMGLLDEAIGELQKVCQTVDHGHPFPNIMQTYTWLAQCFLDKGVPEAAIRWYDKALQLPNLDQDTRTALHYELASSYETAQDREAALRHFMEVYGSNIDYRDVGERIKALRP